MNWIYLKENEQPPFGALILAKLKNTNPHSPESYVVLVFKGQTEIEMYCLIV